MISRNRIVSIERKLPRFRSLNVSSVAIFVVIALSRLILDIHRKVAQSVVIVSSPRRRCTMLREVVAIGRSRFSTEAYAAETGNHRVSGGSVEDTVNRLIGRRRSACKIHVISM